MSLHNGMRDTKGASARQGALPPGTTLWRSRPQAPRDTKSACCMPYFALMCRRKLALIGGLALLRHRHTTHNLQGPETDCRAARGNLQRAHDLTFKNCGLFSACVQSLANAMLIRALPLQCCRTIPVDYPKHDAALSMFSIRRAPGALSERRDEWEATHQLRG